VPDLTADRSPPPEAHAQAKHDATATNTRVVLATSDPLFAALCKRALAGTNLTLLAAVPPPELLQTARQLAPDLLVVDADGEEFAALKALTTKVMLVSEARLVLVSAYLAPGSPGLCALLQSIAATFVQKPAGPSSLSLAEEDGLQFVAALKAAFAAHEAHDVAGLASPLAGVLSGSALGRDFDAGWDLEEAPPPSPTRANND
jgi:chemotaxis response regulator CheB